MILTPRKYPDYYIYLFIYVHMRGVQIYCLLYYINYVFALMFKLFRIVIFAQIKLIYYGNKTRIYNSLVIFYVTRLWQKLLVSCTTFMEFLLQKYTKLKFFQKLLCTLNKKATVLFICAQKRNIRNGRVDTQRLQLRVFLWSRRQTRWYFSLGFVLFVYPTMCVRMCIRCERKIAFSLKEKSLLCSKASLGNRKLQGFQRAHRIRSMYIHGWRTNIFLNLLTSHFSAWTNWKWGRKNIKYISKIIYAVCQSFHSIHGFENFCRKYNIYILGTYKLWHLSCYYQFF